MIWLLSQNKETIFMKSRSSQYRIEGFIVIGLRTCDRSLLTFTHPTHPCDSSHHSDFIVVGRVMGIDLLISFSLIGLTWVLRFENRWLQWILSNLMLCLLVASGNTILELFVLKTQWYFFNNYYPPGFFE